MSDVKSSVIHKLHLAVSLMIGIIIGGNVRGCMDAKPLNEPITFNNYEKGKYVVNDWSKGECHVDSKVDKVCTWKESTMFVSCYSDGAERR